MNGQASLELALRPILTYPVKEDETWATENRMAVFVQMSHDRGDTYYRGIHHGQWQQHYISLAAVA